jgi:hypothetical protein
MPPGPDSVDVHAAADSESSGLVAVIATALDGIVAVPVVKAVDVELSHEYRNA